MNKKHIEPSSLIFNGSDYSFKGFIVVPECDVLALQVAAAWSKGVVDSELLRLYGLPSGKATMPSKAVEHFFKEVWRSVCLLGEMGLFKSSPELDKFGFRAPDCLRPEVELCNSVNPPGKVLAPRDTLEFIKGRFERVSHTEENLAAWCEAGIMQIALQNGAALYGVCSWDKCGRIYRKQRSTAQYCSPSHRARAAQIRLGI